MLPGALRVDQPGGVDIGPSEDGAFWLRFLRGLVSRGLAGVQLVISDSHQGLKSAIAAVLQGASWQRCRTHFMRNALCLVPKGTQQMVAAIEAYADDVRAGRFPAEAANGTRQLHVPIHLPQNWNG